MHDGLASTDRHTGTAGVCRGWAGVETGEDTEPLLLFRVTGSTSKEGTGFLLWDTGAQRGWEALGWGRIAWNGGQQTIHSGLGLLPDGDI